MPPLFAPDAVTDHRRQPRAAGAGTLKLHDPAAARFVACQVADASPGGYRLELPADVHLPVGRRVKLAAGGFVRVGDMTDATVRWRYGTSVGVEVQRVALRQAA